MADVEDAIILAGGMGTRMLPASLYMPKETMPLVDTPIINHLIWEAARAGVSRVHVVLSKRKMEMLGGYFTGKYSLSPEIRPDLPRMSLSMGVDSVEVIPYVQESSLGVAHAFSCALHNVAGPFLVILGDNLVMFNHPSPQESGPENASVASLELVEAFHRTGLPAVGICKVNNDDLSKYGVVVVQDGLISQIIEKPDPDDAPSNYVLCGRYLFPSNAAEVLEMLPLSKYGEMQSIKMLEYFVGGSGLAAVNYADASIFDSGDPISWLKSQIEHSLHRNDLRHEILNWLNQVISRELGI